ncbi:hypothetical protein GCM10017557_56240 [Streptomyces aurantiacus]|uniref:Uncharacterized protein n=1 Tax=Streptomyces aurantiacus TaxID=47760 RepID=A0A7G1PCF5_9ACTN|nr:hypothetical protein [Streptomyces aurantiacus]BCL30765.1 hypothetical protein GCM10017557_56240 [Streptomyces aurantiacus]
MEAARRRYAVQHSTVCVEQAEETVKELREVLAAAGIKLPTLGIGPANLAREAPCPLVELGRCSVETAARLAAVLG